jgi:hypothetical protein
VISSLSPVSAKDFHTHKSEMRAEMDKLKAAYTEGHFPQERPEAIASPRAFPPSPPGLVSPNSFGRHDRIPPAREEGTVKGVGRSHNDVIQIPLKFQPLVEAMKAAGKALISVSDLEGQLKVWSVKLNVPVENINSLMSKATEAQIIISTTSDFEIGRL